MSQIRAVSDDMSELKQARGFIVKEEVKKKKERKKGGKKGRNKNK